MSIMGSGRGGDRDEQFVEKICRVLGNPFPVQALSGSGAFGKWKLGEEETGRIVRKQAFSGGKKETWFSGEQSKKNGQFRVALAHNRNDLAETMLHHLARGTGIRGLSGIQAVNGEIIRPVLCLERKEIVNYLKERGISSSQTASIFQMTIQETGSVTIFFRLWNRRSMQKRWSIWQKPHGFWTAYS